MKTSLSILLDGTDCDDFVKAERSYGNSVKLMLGTGVTGHIKLHMAKKLLEDLTRTIAKIEAEDDQELYPVF